MNKKGATVVELLVYITILSLILGVFFSLMVSVFSTFASVRATRAAITATQTGFERMVREVRGASAIDTQESIFDTTIGRLALVDATGSDIVFSVQDGVLYLSIDDGALVRLTPEGIALEQFLLTHIDTGTSQGVSIVVTFKDTRGGDGVYEVKTSIIARGSYE
ncbi:MAG: hypothetical protein Q8P93_04855 [bacterium]|nr:hypothetical protein [bacterium]